MHGYLAISRNTMCTVIIDLFVASPTRLGVTKHSTMICHI